MKSRFEIQRFNHEKVFEFLRFFQSQLTFWSINSKIVLLLTILFYSIRFVVVFFPNVTASTAAYTTNWKSTLFYIDCVARPSICDNRIFTYRWHHMPIHWCTTMHAANNIIIGIWKRCKTNQRFNKIWHKLQTTWGWNCMEFEIEFFYFNIFE